MREQGNIPDDIGGGWEESNLICCLRRCTVMFGCLKGIERNLDISFSDVICQFLVVLHTPRYMMIQNKHVTSAFIYYLFKVGKNITSFPRLRKFAIEIKS